MKKMCNLLTEEINAQKAFRGQAPSSRSIGVDIERFNQLLSQVKIQLFINASVFIAISSAVQPNV